ncbi:MAG: CpsD/CapB family tyrosine-protein kinase [Clostridium sp.]|nr:CpsD/CapB family tyrosine-protein kinase [Clostridium sp.]MDU7084655.1 CpsD/CapB family tyrosine-protein kinase [Clostridium sp.]
MFIYNKLPHSISAESYKSIRTSIKYASIDRPIKTILITSAVPGEGKSTVAGNLAIALSENGNNVLLMDCDLRKPTIHKKFKLSNLYGLTNVLLEHENSSKAIQTYSSRLKVMVAGTIPPNPSEILGSNTFEKFLNGLKNDFDYIIIDCPPVLAVTDATLLAGRVDGVAYVVRYGKTKDKIIVNGYKKLEDVKAPMLGSILNACDIKKKDSYYYYYEEKKRLFRKKKSKRVERAKEAVKEKETINEMDVVKERDTSM